MAKPSSQRTVPEFKFTPGQALVPPSGLSAPPAAPLPDKVALATAIKRQRIMRKSGCWFWTGRYAGAVRRRPVIFFSGIQYDVVRACLYIAGKLPAPDSGGQLIATCENKKACCNPEHHASLGA